MAKVSDEAKKIYFDKIAEYKKTVEHIHQRENEILKMINADDPQIGYKKITLANEATNIISFYLLMNELSQSLLGMKNENALNDGRKLCYKALIYLEETFTDYIDVPYGDYEEKVLSVDDYPEMEKYKLIRKLGFAIQGITDGFGENSKWKWSLVELECRVATLAKNCINLKKFIKGIDPRSDGYQQRLEHFKLTKRLLDKAAENFRLKYELSTSRIDDFRMAINYLGALKRLLVLTNRTKEIEDLKRKIDIWKTKMDKDLKIREKKALMAKMKKR